MSKFVKFVGDRIVPMRVHVIVDGVQVNSRGYIASAGTILELSDPEANVLLGVTQPAMSSNGAKIEVGFYVDGNLGEAGLTGEKWQEVTRNIDSDGLVTYTPVATGKAQRKVSEAVPVAQAV